VGDGHIAGKGDAPLLADTRPAPIDRAVLEALRDLQGEGEPDVVAEFIALFLDEAPPLLAAIRGGVTEGSADTVTKAAHRLKSASANMGASRMAALCAELEHQGWSGTVNSATVVVAQLEREWERVVVALDAERAAENQDFAR
jgi:HPt (histidine-containing phosphotransfer) domain-containing protein